MFCHPRSKKWNRRWICGLNIDFIVWGILNQMMWFYSHELGVALTNDWPSYLSAARKHHIWMQSAVLPSCWTFSPSVSLYYTPEDSQSIIQEVSYFCYYSFSKLTIFKTSVRVCVCYRLRSNKFIYWNPNPQCDNIWKKGLWEVVSLRYEIMRVEPHDEISALPTRRKEIRDFPLFLPCENTVRKWPSIGKEEDSHQESNWPPPWS